jgi:hypothetical protein
LKKGIAMAISKADGKKVVDILNYEFGPYKSLKVIERLLKEVKGNSSYRKTLQGIKAGLEEVWGGKLKDLD